ncbi:MAG: class I SAM-dependent methyltransferase [Mesorhizobium sp.]
MSKIIDRISESTLLSKRTIDFLTGGRLRNIDEIIDIKDINKYFSNEISHQLVYNLTHVERGRKLYKLIEHILPDNTNLSVLDIGSGVGGALIAFGEKGFELHGIELSANRKELSEENFAINNLKANIFSIDLCNNILDAKYDVVICNSVIEHVNDPMKMMIRFGDLLNPGGVLLFGVANHEAMGNVISDPHYGLFGLTLLINPWARHYYSLMAGDKQSYSVTEWLSIKSYLSIIEDVVGPAQLIPPQDELRGVESVPELLSRLASGYMKAANDKKLEKNKPSLIQLSNAFAHYMGELSAAYSHTLSGLISEDEFKNKYVRKSFYIVSKKQ